MSETPDEKVLIEGHTDSVGPQEDNLALSKRRAEAAAEFLVTQMNFKPERLVLQWYGEDRPVASGKRHPIPTTAMGSR